MLFTCTLPLKCNSWHLKAVKFTSTAMLCQMIQLYHTSSYNDVLHKEGCIKNKYCNEQMLCQSITVQTKNETLINSCVLGSSPALHTHAHTRERIVGYVGRVENRLVFYLFLPSFVTWVDKIGYIR